MSCGTASTGGRVASDALVAVGHGNGREGNTGKAVDDPSDTTSDIVYDSC